jgi:L-fuculokinase
MEPALVLVIDIGATNIRAIAVDRQGSLVHTETEGNGPVPQRPDKNWLVWDTEKIWEKLLACAGKTIFAVGEEKIVSIVVTSFSDDGAPIDEKGTILYPVISWQCPRTVGIAETIDRFISPGELFEITGEQIMRQHTIFRLLWLKENEPEIFKRTHHYLMFPGLMVYRLTGKITNDPTTADSMMLLDIKLRSYSSELIKKVGCDAAIFPPLLEPGTVVGELLPSVKKRLGVNKDIPVVVGGHDTQFAVFGSGCLPGEAALSSGTWEILFLRSDRPNTGADAFERGIKNECDAVPDLFNVGQQWIGSGATEWLIGHLYGGKNKADTYRQLIEEGQNVPRGSNGLMIEPSLLPGSGISRRYNTSGTILGVTLQTSRGELYRAFLEGLSFQLRHAVENLGDLMGVAPPFLTVVGGGSRNELWNRIRADVLNIPIRVTHQKENTVVGAAVFGFLGAGVYKDYQDAYDSIDFVGEEVTPSPQRDIYDELFEKFKNIGPKMEWFYRS